MLVVLKTLFVLFLDLTLCYLFGTIINNRILKKIENPIENILVGFFAEQALFQVLALLVHWKSPVLHHLSMLWMFIICMSVIMGIIFARKQMVSGIKKMMLVVNKNKLFFTLMVTLIVVFCYYVSTHGEINEDARYYIGLVNTTVSTDSIYQYNVYTGEQIASYYERRAFSTFEIQSAVLAQIFDIHALVITRIFRACQNVLLTCMTVYICATQLFYRSQNNHKKSMQLVMLYLLIQPIFANTIYTPSAFLLFRAYEGKAFAANVIALFVLYQAIRVLRTKQKKELFLFLLIWWGSIAVSMSAVVLVVCETVALLVPSYAVTWLRKRKEDK